MRCYAQSLVGKPSKLRGRARPDVRGAKNYNWTGGDDRISKTRVYIKGAKIRARVLVEKYLDRKLSSVEIVHHINGEPGDDRLENLFVFKHRAAHGRWHAFLNRHGLKGLLESNLPYVRTNH